MATMQLMLVDDDEPFARRVATAFPDVQWTTASDARAVAETGAQDGFVIDVNLGHRGGGWEIARQLAGAPLLMLTDEETLDVLREARRQELDVGFKSEWQRELSRFCRRVRQGLAFRTRSFAAKHGLTRRERQVLRLLVGDLDRDEIAERLRISTWTVTAHLQSIMRKTGLPRAAAVRRRLRK